MNWPGLPIVITGACGATEFSPTSTSWTRIEGRAWVGYNGQGEWRFTLLLTDPVASREGIPWSSLLPPLEVTRWLTVDPDGKRLVIEPTAAEPYHRP